MIDARAPRLEPSRLRHPLGLALYEKPALGEPRGTILCVHGTLDRARSFARLARRLPEYRVIAYDRRGYESSQHVTAVPDLETQVADLHSVIEVMAGGGPVDVFGHSMGGSIAITSAIFNPMGMRSVVTYESPLRWLLEEEDWWVPAPSPEEEAETFFSMMTSPGSWERLNETERAHRRADGCALVADLQMSRREIPFGVEELSELKVPLIMGLGGGTDITRFSETADIVTGATKKAELVIVPDLVHGAHLRTPDALATFLIDALGRCEQIGVNA